MNCIYCDKPVVNIIGRWYHTTQLSQKYLWCSNGTEDHEQAIVYGDLQAEVERGQRRIL